MEKFTKERRVYRERVVSFNTVPGHFPSSGKFRSIQHNSSFIMTSTTFLCLPNDLLSVLYTDWLEWKEVARLDIVLCNKIERKSWLKLLKNRCVFTSCYKWLCSRHIKTRTLTITDQDLFNNKLIMEWLQNTAPFLTTTTLFCLVPIANGLCSLSGGRLRNLIVDSCTVDEAFWQQVRKNPHLVQLQITSSSVWCTLPEKVPTNIPLLHVRNLDLRWNSFHYSYVYGLIIQLTSLQSLKLEDVNLSKICRLLPQACPLLVHLDLSCANPINGFNASFCVLMANLKLGLRCLLLPSFVTLTTHELQLITQYHSHSLRCFRILYSVSFDRDALPNLINGLTHVHTLHVDAQSVSVIMQKRITNRTITHLILSSRHAAVDLNLLFLRQFQAVTKLSLIDYGDYSSVPADIARLRTMRPLIHTVYVDKEEFVYPLRTALPSLKVLLHTDIDIFVEEF